MSKQKNKETPKEKLYDAIREGNMSQVLDWVKQVNKNKKYPLHWGDESMKKFRNKIVKHLIEVVQIDVNIQTILIVSRSKYYWDDTALHIAAREGHVEILQYLLTKEIKKDIKNYGGKRANEVTEDARIIQLVDTGIYPADGDEEPKTTAPSNILAPVTHPDPKPVEEQQVIPPVKVEPVKPAPQEQQAVFQMERNVDTKEMKILMENLQREKQKVEDLEDAREKQMKELSDKKNRITELLEAVNEAQKKCQEQGVELEQLKKENEHMLSEVMGAKSSEETIRKLKQKLKDTRDTNTNLENLVSSMKKKVKEKEAEMKEMEDNQKENSVTSGWEGMRKFFEENLKVSGLSTKIKKIVEIHQTLNELPSIEQPGEQHQQQQQQQQQRMEDMSKFEAVLEEFQAYGKDVGQGVTRLRQTMKNEGFLEVKKFFRSFLQGEEQFIQFLETSNKTYERYYRENNQRQERSKTVEEIFKNYRRDFRALKKAQKATRQLQLKLDLLEDDTGSDDEEEEDEDLLSTDEEEDASPKSPKKKKKKDDSKIDEMRKKVQGKERELFALKRKLEKNQAKIANMDCFPLYKRTFLSKIYNLNFKKEQRFVDSFGGKGVLMLDRDLSDYNDIKLIYSNNENRIYRGTLRGGEEEEEEKTRNEVVIKVLPFDRRSEKLVQNEVHNLLNLRHPNIISIHCVFPFQEYKKMFLGVEMESVNQDLLHWVKGRLESSRQQDNNEQEDLNELISLKNKQNPSVIKDVMFQIASGLAFIHEKGIIHRDLKPQNLLVMKQSGTKTSDFDDYIVKIIDFGISKNENSNFFTTMGVHMLSTQRYKPCHDVKIVKKSDVFSLGIIYYEILVMNSKEDGYEMKGCEEFGDSPEESLEECFSKDERDLLCKMLHSNPLERISSDDILDHPYFEECMDKLKRRRKREEKENNENNYDRESESAPPIEEEEHFDDDDDDSEEEEDVSYKKE